MAKINFSEVNSFIKTLYAQVNLDSLIAAQAQTMRAWFISNMSKIGRYSSRDFERFGNLYSEGQEQGRQDGWVAVTEEVTEIDHITYGTGILYIHGEMEIPGKGKPIQNDSFSQNTGSTEHFKITSSAADGAFEGDDASNPIVGYVWSFESVSSGVEYGYSKIIENVSGIKLNDTNEVTPEPSATTPTTFNDSEVYDLDNERNNYPLIIINSAQPESINRLLSDNIDGKTAIYDGSPPAAAESTFGPSADMSVGEDDRKNILQYISPMKAEN
jgi:hypothetical protein